MRRCRSENNGKTVRPFSQLPLRAEIDIHLHGGQTALAIDCLKMW
jgi:hypothetical protein